MRCFGWKLGALVSATLAVPCAAGAQTIVNLDATNPTWTTQAFAAGTYSMAFIGIAEGGQFDAWNAWGRLQGCDGNGENCNQGWMMTISADFGHGTDTFTRTDMHYFEDRDGAVHFATPEQALASIQAGPFYHAYSGGPGWEPTSHPFIFTLASDQSIQFQVSDNQFYDNWGGVSLRFSAVDAAVPEPATWAMMIFGFGMIGSALRRRRALLPMLA